jgi:hypothetical protein
MLGVKMTKKQSRRAHKRKAVRNQQLSQIDQMKKKSVERKVSESRIAQKEENMINFYALLMGGS